MAVSQWIHPQRQTTQSILINALDALIAGDPWPQCMHPGCDSLADYKTTVRNFGPNRTTIEIPHCHAHKPAHVEWQPDDHHE